VVEVHGQKYGLVGDVCQAGLVEEVESADEVLFAAEERYEA
jgi:hypothetical protein